MACILGIGNALTDIVVTTSEKVISQALGLEKGSVSHVDKAGWERLWPQISKLGPRLIAGGGAANTITSLARLGMTTAFLGKVGNDASGKAYRDDLSSNGVRLMLMEGTLPSGCSCILCSKEDSSATIVSYVGAAGELCADDLNEEQFKGVKHLHIEGYLIPRPGLLEKALYIAKRRACTVSLDLASKYLVSSKLDWLRGLVQKYVDLVFANEEEAFAFCGAGAEEAAGDLASCCGLAVVKLAGKGSLVHDGSSLHKIAPYPARFLDQTGAGDNYAAGFIYGLEKGLSLDDCGVLASFIAAKTVEVQGARIDASRWQQILDRTNR